MNIIHLRGPIATAIISISNEKPISYGWSENSFPKKKWAIIFREEPSIAIRKAAIDCGLEYMKITDHSKTAITIPNLNKEDEKEAAIIFNNFSKRYEIISKKISKILTSHINGNFSKIGLSYDRSKIEPGYEGKFIIQNHDADEAGKHWDFRLEFPVNSLKKSLGKEYGDKPGSVLRSFVVKNRKLPSKKDKVFIIETKDHPMEYKDFEGEIEKGYGKGKVEIWDKGTFKLIENENDKKYVFDFKGDKLKGHYALVEFKDGYLWVKANEKMASAIDYPRPIMYKGLWKNHILRPSAKIFIYDKLFFSLKESGFKDPMRWIINLIMTGSATGYNYKEDGDVDIDVLYSMKLLRKSHPEYYQMSDKQLHNRIQRILDQNRDKKFPGTQMTLSFMLLNAEKDGPHGDNIYDLFNDKWKKVSPKIPVNFDPDLAFKKQKKIADSIVNKIFSLFADIRILNRDLYRIQQYIRYYDRLQTKKVITMLKIKILCSAISKWRKIIWNFNEEALKEKNPVFYPAFNFSVNWDERYIIFNYIARYGLHEPVQRLFEIFEGEPCIDIIKNYFTIEDGLY